MIIVDNILVSDLEKNVSVSVHVCMYLCILYMYLCCAVFLFHCTRKIK